MPPDVTLFQSLIECTTISTVPVSSDAITDYKHFFSSFKLVFSLIDKEVDERPAGRRVGLVSHDTDYGNSFGLSRILRSLMAPSVVVNVNPVHVFSLIDKEVDGPRSGTGPVMVPVFLFSDLGDPGCGVWISSFGPRQWFSSA